MCVPRFQKQMYTNTHFGQCFPTKITITLCHSSSCVFAFKVIQYLQLRSMAFCQFNIYFFFTAFCIRENTSLSVEEHRAVWNMRKRSFDKKSIGLPLMQSKQMTSDSFENLTLEFQYMNQTINWHRIDETILRKHFLIFLFVSILSYPSKNCVIKYFQLVDKITEIVLQKYVENKLRFLSIENMKI